MDRVHSKEYVDDDGVKVHQTTVITYQVKDYSGRWSYTFWEHDEARAINFTAGRQSDGSGVYKKTVKVEQRKWFGQERMVKTITETVDYITIADFNDDGKKQNELFIAKQNCKHDKGTRTESWGAGCSYDYSTYCAFCGRPVPEAA